MAFLSSLRAFQKIDSVPYVVMSCVQCLLQLDLDLFLEKLFHLKFLHLYTEHTHTPFKNLIFFHFYLLIMYFFFVVFVIIYSLKFLRKACSQPGQIVFYYL